MAPAPRHLRRRRAPSPGCPQRPGTRARTRTLGAQRPGSRDGCRRDPRGAPARGAPPMTGSSLGCPPPDRTAPARPRALAPLSGQRGVYGGACARSRFQGGAFYAGSLRTLRLREPRAVARGLGGCWLPLRAGGVDANLSGETRLR